MAYKGLYKADPSGILLDSSQPHTLMFGLWFVCIYFSEVALPSRLA